MLNHYRVIGFIDNKPHLKYIPTLENNKLITFSKVNFSVRHINPATQKLLFVYCVAYREIADKVIKALKKDFKVYIEGELFISKNQLQKVVFGVKVSSFSVLREKDENN